MQNELGLFLRTLEERVDPGVLMSRLVEGPADSWQNRLLSSTSETIMVLASRRIGKSTTVGVLAAQEVAKPDHTVLIISPTLSQSQLLFAKITRVWGLMGLPIERAGRNTMTEMNLENGSQIVCVPAGQDGESARGYGVKNGLLIYEESAFIPDKVYASTMAIAEDGGRVVLITTPGGKSGKAYDMWTQHEEYPDVERITACSLDLPRMAKTVAKAKRNMSKLEFDVEHGLRWMGRGAPFFDSETIDAAFIDAPQLQLGNIYAGL